MHLTRHNPASVTLEIPSASTQRLSVMLSSDVHFDSCTCDLELFTKHLRLAEERKAPVLIAGDLFDAMQGRDDPRRSIEDLKHEYKVASYFDAIVLDASAFLRQFKVPMYIIGLGNHETSVLNKISTNLVERLCYDLRLHGQSAEAMGYWGYVRFQFKYKKGAGNASKLLYFHHGNGMNAAVTHGIIDANRQSVYLTDPDIIVNGHNHKSYTYPQAIERLSQRTMMPYNDIRWFLRTPGYTKSPGEAISMFGYNPEKHRSPTPKGCLFLDMEYNHPAGDTITSEILQKIT